MAVINSGVECSQYDSIYVLDTFRKNPDAMLPVSVGKQGCHILKKGSAGSASCCVRDLSKNILRNYPYLQGPVSALNMERELFLVYLAQHLVEIPQFINHFSALYQTNPQAFYAAASTSKYYHHMSLNDGNLLGDIALKRIFGILLVAEVDGSVRADVEGIFYDHDSALLPLIESRSPDLLLHETDMAYSGGTALSAHIFYYLLSNHDDGQWSPVVNHYAYTIKITDETCEKCGSEDGLRAAVDSVSDPFRYLILSSPYVWKIVKELRSIRDINDFARSVEYLDGASPMVPGNVRILNLVKNCPPEDPCNLEIQDAYNLISGICTMLNLNRLASCSLFRGKELSKEQQKKVLAAYVQYNQQIQNNSRVLLKSHLTISTYVALVLSMFMVQDVVESKRVFFENNNETMFPHLALLKSELEKADKEKNALHTELLEQQQTIRLLKEQLITVQEDTRKDEKNALAPYMEENLLLRRRVEELEKELSTEKEKDTELGLLRSFAFDVQSEYVAEEQEATLHEVIKHNKIIVIGGHINWRNQLKNKYPEIVVLDGHLETQDFSMLQTAAFVFLNTANMSHSVYYKVIDVLRRGNTAFDYLGRTINQDLYEKEMADILSRHRIH